MSNATKLTPEEYQQQLVNVAMTARLLVDVDIPDLLQRIERAHSFGCMLDPTLYRAKVEAMDQDKDMLEAALPLWRWARKVQASAQAKQAQDRAVMRPCSCGGTFERQGVSSGTCGPLWGPPTCAKCGAILSEESA